VPPPPPNVDFSKVENPDPSLHTARDRLTAHRKDAACAGCHKITDPMGLALENFDGAGRFRQTESGATIDTSGDLDGKQFTDVGGLAQAVHANPALTSCLVGRMYNYANGGPTSPSDRPLLKVLNQRFADEGYRVPGLMRTIALGMAYSQVKPGKAAPPADKTVESQQKITLNRPLNQDAGSAIAPKERG
jgi:hypothetical protein